MKTAIVAILLLAGASVAYFYERDTHANLPPLHTAALERGDLMFSVNATGTVEPEEVIDVGAQVAGKIQILGEDPRASGKTIDYVSPVKKGTVLARIDDSLYQADVDEAKAQVESAQAQVESTGALVLEAQANVERAEKDLLQLRAKLFQAERDWVRAQNTWKASRGAISESDYDLAKSTYDAADASVGVGNAAIAQAMAAMANSKAAATKSGADLKTAQATLKRAEINLSYCTIKSPVDGVIIDRRVNVGQTVVSSLNSPSLFLIAKDLKRMQVWASVNEADISNIHPGQKVQFTVDTYPGETFEGVVAPDQPRLNASMNQNVVTYTVVVMFDNSDGRLRPYLTADLQFEVASHRDVLLVTNSALRWQPSPERLAAAGMPALPSSPLERKAAKRAESDAGNGSPGETTIWLEENGQIRPVKVRTVLSDGTHTEMTGEGLQEGARVVVGEEFAASASDASDPFSPKMFGTKRPQ